MLTGEDPRVAKLMVDSKGVTFDSMRLFHGVEIAEGGSMTMKNCTMTDVGIALAHGGASLVMEDTRVTDCSRGVHCSGSNLKATRCWFGHRSIVRR